MEEEEEEMELIVVVEEEEMELMVVDEEMVELPCKAPSPWSGSFHTRGIPSTKLNANTNPL